MNKTTKLLIGVIIIAIVIGIGFLISQKLNDVDSDKNNPTSANTENVEIKNNIETTYQNYVNQDFNIKLSYPDIYELQEGLMGTVAVFLSPKESSTDLFQENLNVIVQDLSAQPMTLDEYNDLSLGQIETLITDSKIISSKKTTLAGKSAYEVIYTGRQGQYNLKWRQLWTAIDNKAYVLSYTSEINQFDNYFEVFDKMINSFEVSN
ncbi:MAG: PsbP-related protein [Patescibacteria group bacterium]